MKILLANKFYYRRGGDCIYMLNLEKLLKAHVHEVAVFAMDYPENLDTPWKKYFPQNMSKLMAFTRPFGDGEVKSKFSQLLNDFKPDVVHLNNIHTQLSPLIAKMAHEFGAKVVWTLHDTKLVCPCYTCMRNGKWCEECFTDKLAVVKHRCMPGSIPGAIVGYLEAKKWNKDVLQKYVDWFLPPSKFMMDTCVKGGYSPEKFRVLCNFIDVTKLPEVSALTQLKDDYYVYLGRVNEVKGVRTLCKAAAQLDKKLIVIGDGESLPELKETYKNCSHIEFKGQMQWEEFMPILQKARFMVLPAEWSENNPLTVIESQSLGTPVLGANIGGIPELTDYTFCSGNVNDLKSEITRMWDTEFDYKTIASEALTRYNSETYYNKIINIYKQ